MDFSQFDRTLALTDVVEAAQSPDLPFAALMLDQGGALATTGEDNAYVIATTTGFREFQVGIKLMVRVDRDNTGPAFLSVDGLGPKSWRDASGKELTAGALRKGRFYTVVSVIEGKVGTWWLGASVASADDIPDLLSRAAPANVLDSGKVAARTLSASEPTVPIALPDYLATTVRPEQMGADKSGATDAAPIIAKVLAKALASGVPARFDKGRYLLKTPVNVTLTASLEVQCHRDAVFVADAALNNKMIMLTNPAASYAPVGSVKWTGGTFDATALKNSGPGEALDCLTISENVEDVEVVGIKFVHCGNAASTGLGAPTVVSGGSGYTSATVVIPPPDRPNGRQAVANAVLVDGVVAYVTFTDNGRGYSSLPSLTISGDGSGAVLTASLVSDYRTSGGDSSIFVVASRTTIRGCTFVGSNDCAIYPSARANETYGEALNVEGCYFELVNNCVVAKRGFKRFICANNHVTRCRTGFGTGPADITLPPGKGVKIVNNYFTQVAGSTSAIRRSDGAVFAGNEITDFGFLPDGVRISGWALSLEGCKGCAVFGNTVKYENFVSGGNQVAFRIMAYTQNAITLNSTGNILFGNVISGIKTGFQEADAAQDDNAYINNRISLVALPYDLLGPLSAVGINSSGQHKIISGSSALRLLSAGYTGSEEMQIQRGYQTTNANMLNLAFVAVPAGSAVRVTAEYIANAPDGSASFGALLSGVFRRGPTGTLVQVGATEATMQNDFVAPPTVLLFADAPFNAVRIRGQGLPGTTINWRINIKYTILTTNS